MFHKQIHKAFQISVFQKQIVHQKNLRLEVLLGSVNPQEH